MNIPTNGHGKITNTIMNAMSVVCGYPSNTPALMNIPPNGDQQHQHAEPHDRHELYLELLNTAIRKVRSSTLALLSCITRAAQ